MPLKITVYTATRFKEYNLPAINDADYVLPISRNDFDMQEDIMLQMEIIDGVWKFKPSDEYQLSKGEFAVFGAPLCDDDIISFRRGDIVLTFRISEKSATSNSFRKYDISRASYITVGKSEDNTIVYHNTSYVSRQHMIITRRNDGMYISDRSENGTFVNSYRISAEQKLNFGDIIDIFGLRIIYFGNIISVNTAGSKCTIDENVLPPYSVRSYGAANLSRVMKKKRFFHRAPRNVEKLFTEAVEIEAPPQPKEIGKKPLFMVIGPSFTMAIPMTVGCGVAILASKASGMGTSAFMYTGIITAVLSAVIGVVWALINLKYEKKSIEEQELHRFDAYSKYLVEQAEQIKDMYNANHKSMCEMYPHVEECSNYNENSQFLWNRNFTHSDVLFHRLGIGSIPFQVRIGIPQKKFALVSDELADRPAYIRDTYKMLNDVPVGIDMLEKRLIGIIGGSGRQGAIDVARTLTMQIAANNCYTDVKLAFVCSGKTYDDAMKDWEFARWLPHVWSEDKKTRYIAFDRAEASDVFYDIANVMRIREENAAAEHGKDVKIVKPHYILVITEPEWLEGELISKYVYGEKEEYGLTTIMLAEHYEDLPNLCKNIIENTPEYQGIYNVQSQSEERTDARFDYISREAAEGFARRISSVEVRETESGTDVPTSLSFFEMYDIDKLEELNVLERWKKNRTYDSMKALVGQKAGGADCYLDIHEKYHGPHGLIAGTTGSGKSETLQTYMLSLAVNFSPKDVGFFVIDFKGGGMANLFSNLPHMIGQISNLSGNQVHRAMVSIKSENKRRQRIFTEHGVNNINLYTRLVKNNEATIPVPHLFIIIDEFAELKREEPEFMKELISVAQVGRSLGVHLILATQKPSGTVDDNIWSNSKFRMCLRVQDRQDSNDMLHKPDAAYITQAGRCYLQVGNDEIYEYFQSGWSGAAYDPDEGSVSGELASMIGNAGKPVIIGSRNKIKRKEKQRLEWIMFLIKTINKSLSFAKKSITQCINDTEFTGRLIGGVYNQIENSSYDYDDSKYNRARLEDFIRILAGIGYVEETEVYSADVIQRANSNGIKLPEVKEITQLDAVVEYLAEIAVKNDYENKLNLWLPVLPKMIVLDELPGYSEYVFKNGAWREETEEEWNLDAIVGLYDDPENQAQNPVYVDFATGGHLAICGGVVSGKSTFLQTLLYSLINKYTPEQLNIYSIDFSSNMTSVFEDAPHCGGIMNENDLDKVDKFFNMIMKILEERKEMFKGGSYSQYVRANGVTVPAIVVAIDNFGRFKEKTNAIYDPQITQLSAEGEGNGIYLAITAGGFGSADIQSRVADNLRNVITLDMGDKFKFADVLRTMSFNVLPEKDIRGRGLALVGNSVLEYQAAVAVKADDDYQRSELIVAKCREMASAWNGATARKVPEIPAKPKWSDISQLEEFKKLAADDRNLPFAYNQADATVYSVDLSKVYSYIILGRSKSGKTTLLKDFIYAAAEKDADICVIDIDGNNELRKFATNKGVTYAADGEEVFAYFSGLVKEFGDRNALKRECIAQDMETEDIYAKMNENKRIFIFINDLAKFINYMYEPEGKGADMVGFLENITERGHMHNVFIFGCLGTENLSSVSGLPLYNNLVQDKNGILLGGGASNQNMFEFPGMSYSDQSKLHRPGVGMVPPDNDEPETRTVIIPNSEV